MGIHDVSLPLTDRLPTWPGDPPFRREAALALSRGDPANVSRLDFGAHTGTHVDAPLHFIEGGRTVDDLPLDVLIGPCRVVYAEPAGQELRPDDIGDLSQRLLIKTPNSRLWTTRAPFDESFIGLGEDLARALVRDGVKLLGVDYLSVERFDAGFEHPVHRILLEAGTVVLEGLDLSAVEPGDYDLYCLPLKLAGAEGAPARVVLVDQS